MHRCGRAFTPARLGETRVSRPAFVLSDATGRSIGAVVAPKGRIEFGPNRATVYLRRECGQLA